MSIVPINDAHSSSSSDPLSLDMWDPFSDFPLPLPPSISHFFPHFGSTKTNTRLDWRETSRAHVWKVLLPGFTNEDVLVELQDERVLQVSVESGNFMTRFKVPDDANLEFLKATTNHGVLVVTVPKYEHDTNNRGINGNIRVVEIEGTD
ncbi:hypothetical protein RIF29_32107 [Crotalaria pallida]|uniref:SHSP domain-containing protein n=1 Tax=Crotalaria pallida TaxID=3830 RepID=A0AAN9HXY3_CROPI